MRRSIAILLIGVAVIFSITSRAQSVSQSWVRQLYIGAGSNGPKMAKDGSGNIYLAVTLSGGSDPIYVWKYNASGVFQWSANYRPAGGIRGAVSTITVDASSNVIMTGLWSFSDLPGGFSIATVKFNSSGTQLWSVRYSNGSSFDQAQAATTDAAGNIYIAGSTQIPTGYNPDYLTFKLDPNGVLQWTATYEGTAGANDVAVAIALDAAGNVYITGQSEGLITKRGLPPTTVNTGYDYVTIKYDTTGHILWSRRYTSSSQAAYSDVPTGLVLDASGNVYVTGEANHVGTTVAYNSAGSQLWVSQGSSSKRYTAIAMDASGNIIVAGLNTTTSVTLRTFFVCQYSATGAVNWTRSYNTGGNYTGQWEPVMAVDGQNNVYLAGTTVAPGSTSYLGCNFVTLKYSSSGALSWTAVYNGVSNTCDQASAILLHLSGSVVGGISYPSVYVAGSTDYAGANSYSTVVKYTQSLSTGTRVTENVVAGRSNGLAGSDGGLVLSNWPNPFKGSTAIHYTLPFDGHVILRVYDMAGKLVATPVNARELSGPHTLSFSAGAAGVYSYRVVVTSERGTFTDTKQMVVQ